MIYIKLAVIPKRFFYNNLTNFKKLPLTSIAYIGPLFVLNLIKLEFKK